MGKYLVMLIIPLGALGFLYFQLSSQSPTAKLLDFSSMEINSSTSSNNFDSDDAEEQSNNQVYRWQDDEGNWHYSDKAPTDQHYETQQLQSDINQIQSLNTRSSRETLPTSASNEVSSPYMKGGLPIPSPEKVQKLMQDAKNVEQLLKQRQEMIDNQH